MVSVVILIVITLGVSFFIDMLTDKDKTIILSVVMLNLVMLSVTMLNVITVIVVAPRHVPSTPVIPRGSA